MPFTEIFDKIQLTRPKHNNFDLSHSVKLTTEFGKLIPVMTQECLPGDKFRFKHECGVKFAPLMGPIMSEVDIKLFSFFWPFRLGWKDWEEFITMGETGDVVVNRPKFVIANAGNEFDKYFKSGSLADYLEFPTYDANFDNNGSPTYPRSMVYDQLPFRCYWDINNAYFRDQNLEQEFEFDKSSSDLVFGQNMDATTMVKYFQTARIAWRKDYFTSALPWTQRGPVAKIPITAQVLNIMKRDEAADFYTNGIPVASIYNQNVKVGSTNTQTNKVLLNAVDDANNKTTLRFNNANLYGKVTDIEGTINDLRTMYAVQRWYERNAVGGSRYIEQINAHFGVRSSDGRLQRPEFIGMTTFPLIVNEVLQTSETTSSSPLAQPAGHAFAYNNGNDMYYNCEEHGFIMTLMAVVPKAEYFQGMPRKYCRDTSHEFYWPTFAHLGEDAVYKGELFYNFHDLSGVDAAELKQRDIELNRSTFGYQSRYADYKFSLNRVHGDFKTSNLKTWLTAREFSAQPNLNSEFIRVIPQRDGLNRIWAYQASDFDHIWVNLYNHVHAKRLIPVFSTPI